MVWGKLFLCSVNLTPVIKKKRKCRKGCVWLLSLTWVEFRRKRRIYTGFEYRHTDSHTRRPIQRYMHTQLNICRLCMVNMLTPNNTERKRAEEEIKERSPKLFGSLGTTSSTSRCEGRLKSIGYEHVWYKYQPWTSVVCRTCFAM